MSKDLSTYFLKSLSVILLIVLSFSNISFCEIISIGCKPEATSCCCDHEYSKSVSFQKSCCCELKEAPVQPAETAAAITEMNIKLTAGDVHLSNSHLSIHNHLHATNQHPISFHSPPDSDLNILYSVLRI